MGARAGSTGIGNEPARLGPELRLSAWRRTDSRPIRVGIEVLDGSFLRGVGELQLSESEARQLAHELLEAAAREGS